MGMSFSKLRRRMRRLALLSCCFAAGCGGSATSSGSPTVVATTTQLADMARNIAPGAHVTSLLSPNTDPHEYEVRPDDVKALASADVVLRSGGEVDEWLDGALDAAGVDEQDVVDVGAGAGHRGRRPALVAGPAARREGGGRDRRRVRPRGAADDSAPYVARLKALDAGVRACMDRVPASERKLVTSHDALGYFAARYGITVSAR